MLINLSKYKNITGELKDDIIFKYKMLDDSTRDIIRTTIPCAIGLGCAIAVMPAYSQTVANSINAGMAQDLGQAVEIGLGTANPTTTGVGLEVADPYRFIFNYVRDALWI